MPEAGTTQQSQPKKYEFFVYIVESPSAVDLYHGRSEGTLVANALALDMIPCVTRTAINREAFEAAIRFGLSEAMKSFPGRSPVLHLSVHGGDEGIQLSSDEVVTWNELRELLVPINETLGGVLLLCMSACKGFSACQMAMRTEHDAKHPYFAIVGCWMSPTWSDTAVAYLGFYHRLAKGHGVEDGVSAMNAVTGEESWGAKPAADLHRNFIEYVKAQRRDPGEAQQELEQMANEANLSPTAKALEVRLPPPAEPPPPAA
jgi:hypothetical protein